MSIEENTLHDILISIWYFAPGLNKHVFAWGQLPSSVTILAGTDSSGLVKYRGTKYYVNYEWKTNKIIVERN